MSVKRGAWRIGVVAMVVASSLAWGQASTTGASGGPDRRWLDTTVTPAERAKVDTLVGLPAPAWSDDMRWIGDAHPLEDLFGKVVVVQFWSRADRRGALRLDQLAELRGKSEDLVVIAVHTASGSQGVDQFVERRPVGAPVVIDANGSYAAALGVRSPLANLVIDRAGVVRYALLNPQGLAATTEALLAEPVPERSEGDETEAPAPQRPETRLPPRGSGPKRDASGFWADRITDSFFPEAEGRVESANDLRGKRGPDIQVERWVTAQPDATNKVIVLDFWATWCGPCVGSIPHKNQLQQAFPNEVQVIGVSAEPFETVRAWMPGKGVRYAIGVDTQRTMTRVVGNRFIPHAVVYSPDGVIRWQGDTRSLSKETLGKIVAASRRGASR